MFLALKYGNPLVFFENTEGFVFELRLLPVVKDDEHNRLRFWKTSPTRFAWVWGEGILIFKLG
jgi:hypothetical protein